MVSKRQDVKKSLDNVESKLAEFSHEIDIIKFKEELFEILLIVSTLKDKEKIGFYLSFFEKLIKVMKSKKIWDEVDKELMKDVLTGVADNWRDYKREDLAKIFESWLEKNIV